jgi:transposase-like protein
MEKLKFDLRAFTEKMKMLQGYYPDQLRMLVVLGIRKNDQTVSEASLEFGISKSTIYNWLKEDELIRQSFLDDLTGTETIEEEIQLREAELLRLQRLLEIQRFEGDYLELLIKLASEEVGYDIKKHFEDQLPKPE